MNPYSDKEAAILHSLGFSAVVSGELPAPQVEPSPMHIEHKCGEAVTHPPIRRVGRKMVREFRCGKCNVTVTAPSGDLIWKPTPTTDQH